MDLRAWAKAARAKLSTIFDSPRGLLPGIYTGGRSDPPARGTRELLEAFETTPWLRAVGEKVSTAVAAQVPQLVTVRRGGKIVRDRTLQRANGAIRSVGLRGARAAGELVEIREHPFLDALEDPNPFMDRMALLQITEQHLDFVGDAYWLKARNALGKPAGYWPIPPHWVQETPTTQRPIFRVSWRSWNVEIPASEVRWFHSPAPANPYGLGAGIGWALGDEIQVDEYAAKMASAFFFNRARADFVFVGGTDKTEVERLERVWLSRLQGFLRAHRPFFATGDPTEDVRNRIYEFQQPTMEQLVYPNLRKAERDIILQVWGVPPELFGIVENSNRATIESAEYLFTKWVVAPKLERLRGGLQREFLEEFDERGIVHYDSPVAEDKEHRLAAAKAAPYAPTLDEWRDMQGLPAVGGDLGAARMVPLNSYLTADPLDPETRPKSGGSAPAASAEGGDEEPAA